MKRGRERMLKVILLGVAVLTLVSPALARGIVDDDTKSPFNNADIKMKKDVENQKYIEDLAKKLAAAGIQYDFKLNEHMELVETDDGKMILAGMPEDDDVYYEYEKHQVGGRTRNLIVPLSKKELKNRDKELNEIVNKNNKLRGLRANISGASVINHYGFTHGDRERKIDGNRNVFYMYVKKGETVRVILSNYNGAYRANEDQSAILMNQDGLIVDEKIMRHKNKGPVEATGVLEDVASKDQVYAFFTDDDVGDGFSYKVSVQIGVSGGAHQKGRVFSENWTYYQPAVKPASDPRTIEGASVTLYHVTPLGELYKQTLKDHNGYHFDIESNAAGIIDTGDPNCEPVYSSTPFVRFTDKYEVIMGNERCRNKLKRNNIFLEYPASDLPKEAILPGGNKSFLNPDIKDHQPAIESVVYNKNQPLKHGGQIVFKTDGHDGNAKVLISADNNGDGKFKEVREYRPTIKRGEEVILEWDGKDSNGKEVARQSKVRVEVSIDRAGEIHFVVRDLEMNRGGVQVTALKNLSGVESNVLHYDDSDQDKFPVDWSRTNPRFKGGFSQLDGFDSVKNWDYHAWDYIVFQNPAPEDLTKAPRLASYPGMAGNPKEQDDSLGDGNYMHEWTWDKNYKGVRKETEVGTIDLIYGSLQVKDENKNDFAETDELLSYVGGFYNLGTTNKSNPTIEIDISDEKIDESTIASVYAKVNGKDILTNHSIKQAGGKTYLVIETHHNFTYNDVIEYGFDVKPKGILESGQKDIVMQASIAGGLGLTTPKLIDGLPATVKGEPSKETAIEPAGPELTISKDGVFVSQASSKDYIRYTIKIKNTSKFDAKNISVQDLLEDSAFEGAQIENFKFEGNGKPNVFISDKIEIKMDKFAAGEEATFKFDVIPSKELAGGSKINNTAFVVYDEKKEEADFEIDIPKANPTVSKAMYDMGDENGFIAPGEKIRIVFDVKANSGRALKDFRIIDELDDVKFKNIKNLKVIDAESSKIKENNSTASKIDVLFEAIGQGGEAKLVIEGEMSKGMLIDGEKLKNKAKYSSSNSPGGEVEAEIPVAKPEVDLTKSVEAGRVINKYQTVHPSMQYKYTIDVENTSKAIIYDLEVVDIFEDTFFKKNIKILDSKLENLSKGVKVSSIDEDKVIISELPAGGKLSIVLDVKMEDLSKMSLKDKNGKEIDPSKTYLLENTARARTEEIDGRRHIDVVSKDKEGNSKTIVEVIFPFLEQTKTVEAKGSNKGFGAKDKFKWTIKTENKGKYRAENVLVEEKSKDFFEFVDVEKITLDGKEIDAKSKTFNIASIAPNKSSLVEIEGSIKDMAHKDLPEEIVNIAGVEFADIKRESQAEIKKGKAEVSIIKETDEKYIAAGKTINYQIRVKNQGDVLLKNALIKDEMSHPQIKEASKFVEEANKTRAGKTKELDAKAFIKEGFLIEEFKPQEEIVFDVSFKMPDDMRAGKAVSLDNLASVEVEGLKEESLVSTPIKEADLYAVKTVSDDVEFNDNIDGYAEAKEYLRYTIEVFNDSDVAAKNIRIEDSLEDVAFESAQILDEDFNEIDEAVFMIDDIAAGASKEIIFYVKLNDELPKESNMIVNQADIILDNGNSTSTNKATIELIKPEVELIKDVSAAHPDNENHLDVAVPYRTIQYTFTISNNSIIEVKEPVLKDEMLDENLKDAEVLKIYLAGGEELAGDIKEGIKLPDLEPYSQIVVYMDVKLQDLNRDVDNEFIENQAKLESKNTELVKSKDSFGNEITKLAIGRYEVVGITTVSDDIEGNIINDKVSPNDLILHTITFTNKSNVPLEDVYLVDIFRDDKFKHFELEEAYGYTTDEDGKVMSNFEVKEGNRMLQEAEVGLVEEEHKVVLEVYHRAPENLEVFKDYEDDYLRLSSRLEANNIASTASTDIEGGPESIIEFDEVVTKPAAKVETYAKGAGYILLSSFMVSALASFILKKKKKSRA